MFTSEAWTVVLSTSFAAFLATLSFVAVCTDQYTCLKDGTCYQTSHYGCGFRNAISPTGWQLLNTSEGVSMNTLSRGICAPGLRPTVATSSGALACRRALNFPSAIDHDIQDEAATAPHRRHCGRWIDARKLDVGEERFAFFDADHVTETLESQFTNNPLGNTDMSKFRAQCESMVSSNSQGSSGKVAYDYLRSQMPFVHNEVDALRAIGVLVGHFCEAPARVGITFGSSIAWAKLTWGTTFSEKKLRNAMYAVGESRATRDLAVHFASGHRAATLSSQDLADASKWIVEASFGLGAQNDTSNLPVYYSAENPSLAQFLSAMQDAGGVAGAVAYLKGCAAICAFGVRSAVEGDLGYSSSRSASGIGRLRASAEPFRAYTPSTVLKASTRTWADVVVVPHADVRTRCLRAARTAFSEEYDRLTFDALVTAKLYQRLETLFGRIHQKAEETLRDDTIGGVFQGTQARQQAADKLHLIPPAIAGAPRGTWAGIGRTTLWPAFSSSDGAFTMLLKQARKVYLDRSRMVIDEMHACHHPPLFAASERNAYLVSYGDWACAMILPGLLVSPFAGERFDDESLAMRTGYVWAHELMHVTIDESTWDWQYASALLHSYREGTYTEAIADIGAVETLRGLGYANQTICAHLSQLWCARKGWLWSERAGGGVHPESNLRGDNVCDYLQVHY